MTMACWHRLIAYNLLQLELASTLQLESSPWIELGTVLVVRVMRKSPSRHSLETVKHPRPSQSAFRALHRGLYFQASYVPSFT